MQYIRVSQKKKSNFPGIFLRGSAHSPLQSVTPTSFHPTAPHCHVPPNHTIPPHNRTLPPVTQDLTPELTSTHHTCIPGTQLHAQTSQNQAESTSFNLNCCEDDWQGTRTDLRYMEDKSARARVTRGGGVRHHLSVSRRRGGDLGEYMILNSADFSSLSDSYSQQPNH